MGRNHPSTFTVTRTNDREAETEYIVQIDPEILDGWGGPSQREFLKLRNPDKETEIHSRVQTRPRRGSTDGPAQRIGLDFTIRTALGVPSADDTNYGTATEAGRVWVKPISNREQRWHRRVLNSVLGVRPAACRVRMAVFPDLENRVCRIPANTIELLGIEEGDRVVVESTRGIARGVKALPLDDETRARKRRQKNRDSQRYLDCRERLHLEDIRKTGEDIPEIFLDHDVRQELKLHEISRKGNGVCQPVRVYRDSVHLFERHLYDFTAPLTLVLVGAALRVDNEDYQLLLFLFAGVVWALVIFYRSKSTL
ncbi:hypothetical protein [Halorussus sp. MSC15.2]|uniref:hypothetical protein n=1 Tax=Halorussus sp. MSC15.2 TaxID=2283638 RepID=UPI0013D1EC4B|nr:hypothetical protein [Halorussus sp. MSC15.2]NEU56075.1 hypothetical protein [Halorussus sp. MSC15.2]